MASRATIQFNYYEALRRADEVDSVAGDLDKTCGELDRTIRELSGGWKGESAKQYGAKGERLEVQIGGSARELRQAAIEIRRIARLIYETEMRNLEIAAQRDY